MDSEDATFATQTPVGSRPGKAEDDLLFRGIPHTDLNYFAALKPTR